MGRVPDAGLEALGLVFNGRTRWRWWWGWAHPVVRAPAPTSLVCRDLLAWRTGTQATATAVEVHGVAAFQTVADPFADTGPRHAFPRAVAADVRAVFVSIVDVDGPVPAIQRCA